VSVTGAFRQSVIYLPTYCCSLCPIFSFRTAALLNRRFPADRRGVSQPQASHPVVVLGAVAVTSGRTSWHASSRYVNPSIRQSKNHHEE